MDEYLSKAKKELDKIFKEELKHIDQEERNLYEEVLMGIEEKIKEAKNNVQYLSGRITAEGNLSQYG